MCGSIDVQVDISGCFTYSYPAGELAQDDQDGGLVRQSNASRKKEKNRLWWAARGKRGRGRGSGRQQPQSSEQ